MHKGFSGGIPKYTFHQMRAEIRKLAPDLVFLQEVQGNHFELIAGEMWPHFSYGKNVIRPRGHHGNAFLSKFPILFSENINISQNRLEKRGLLHVVLQQAPDLPKLHAICTHLNLFEASRRVQLEKIALHIKNNIPEVDSLILAGDFNDWRQSADGILSKSLKLTEAFKKLHGKHAKSFPSNFPMLSLDRVYFRGFQTHRALCLNMPPWNKLSDHLPLYVELREATHESQPIISSRR